MAVGLLIPVTAGVSCSWQCHRDRRPPSSEPGTDRASSYGTAVVAAGAGTIIDRKTTTTGATGRYVTLRLGDGRTVRYLHLARVDVALAQKVTRGQRLGASGASGFGTDWYYGPHVHTTLWTGQAWAAPTIDFERHTGPATPPAPPTDQDEGKDDDVALKGAVYAAKGTNVFLLFNEASGFYVEHSGVNAGYNNAIAREWDTGAWPTITEAHAKVLKAALDRVRARAA